jgi:hypothetical protein
MTTGSIDSAEGPASLFDRIVAHETGSDAGGPRSLRPRLPYVFDNVPRQDNASGDPTPGITHGASTIPEPMPAQEPVRSVQAAFDAPRSFEQTRILPDGTPALSQPVLHSPSTSQDSPKTQAHAAVVDEKTPAPRAVAHHATLTERGREPVSAQATPTLALPVAPPAVFTNRGEQRSNPVHPIAVRASLFHSRAEFRAMPLASVVAPPVEQTIEIRIGRIDVRAQLASQAPSPSERTVQSPPDRLASYLGRRSRGSRS